MDDLTASIERSICEVHQLERTIQQYKESSQMLLFERINGLVQELASVQSTADQCQAHIPAEVIKYVDEGRNPDEFTQEFLKACVQRNEVTKGKVEVFKSLRQQLLAEMEEAFPEEIEAYRALRMASLEAVQASKAQPESGAAQANGSTEEDKEVKVESVDT